jgi:hypothetical protein
MKLPSISQVKQAMANSAPSGELLSKASEISLSPAQDMLKAVVKEFEEAIAPTAQNIVDIEQKLDLLLATLGRIEKLLQAIEPLAKLVAKIPFLGLNKL